MIPYIVAGLFGALAVHRTLPDTKVKKLKCIGPRTGLVYNVEEFVGTSFIVVRYQSHGVTLQKSINEPGYNIISVMPDTSSKFVDKIKEDFCNG